MLDILCIFQNNQYHYSRR